MDRYPAQLCCFGMKNILIVQYSQTGQLAEVTRQFCAPLEQAEGITVHHLTLQAAEEYPFPWPLLRFLDTFPETVHQDPPALRPWQLPDGVEFDLVILAYQVWFLSPSQPITAFLQSPEAQALLHGKPVITLIACRNMWLMAQEQVKALLAQAGARLLDNVALVDEGNSLLTFITTPRWMLTGNKGRADGWLPVAGLRPETISRARRFGHALIPALQQDLEKGAGPLLHGLQAARVDMRLIPSERIGRRSFVIWGKLLRACGKPGTPLRRAVLLLYLVFLLSLIITVVPLSMLIRSLLRPLLKNKLQQQQAYFELPSGSGSERLAEFDHD